MTAISELNTTRHTAPNFQFKPMESAKLFLPVAELSISAVAENGAIIIVRSQPVRIVRQNV